MTVDHVSFGVHISDLHDAVGFTGPRLALIGPDEFGETEALYGPRHDLDLLLPLLLRKNGRDHAPKERLEAAADFIDKALAKHGQVLVHCFYGMERSPLAVVYWLHKRKGFKWHDAYKLVKARRAPTLDSTDWLKKELADDCGARHKPRF